MYIDVNKTIIYLMNIFMSVYWNIDVDHVGRIEHFYWLELFRYGTIMNKIYFS